MVGFLIEIERKKLGVVPKKRLNSYTIYLVLVFINNLNFNSFRRSVSQNRQ